MHVKIKLLHPNARLPTRGTDGSSGFDLYACESAEIWPGGSASIRTGISLAPPAPRKVPEPQRDEVVQPDYRLEVIECQVRGRSSLAFKSDMVAHVGTIDNDYRGELAVKLWYLPSIPWWAPWRRLRPHVVNVGDRVGQIVFVPIVVPELVIVDDLPSTTRGSNGFGSTGV